MVSQLKREVVIVLCRRSHSRGLGKSSECFWGSGWTPSVQKIPFGEASELVCAGVGPVWPSVWPTGGLRDYVMWTFKAKLL